ncbi:MAG: type II secretion system secretin GspD [Agarilytica sp.]
MAVSILASTTTAIAQSNKVSREPTYTVQFNDSDILEVIKFVAEITGKTMVIDPRVKGRIKIMSNDALTERELYALFRSVLEISDYTVVEVGDIVRIVPIKDARTSPTSVNKNNATDDSEFITQVIQLKNIAAAKVIPVLRPLVPQNSHLAAYDPSNAIVITDTSANIERMKEVIDKIDKAALPTTEVVKLKYADADAMVAMLEKIQGPEQKQGPQSNRMVMVADTRNNAILLTGEDVKRAKTKKLIWQLDQPQQQTGNVRVVYLEYGDAKEVATVLSKVVQNMSKVASGGKAKGGPASQATVEADEATNALLITAPKDLLDSLLAVVARLDIRRAQVLVEAIIADIKVGDGAQVGVEWLFSNQQDGVFGGSVNDGQRLPSAVGLLEGEDDGDDDTSALANLASGILSSTGQTLGIASDGKEAFTAILSALRGSSKANILSTPSLLTMDNQEATISVGKNVPFRTGSYSSTGNSSNPSNPFTTIQRENVGITLTVTPQVNEGNKILLNISQEVSSLSGAVDGSADLITNESTISTQVLASDGETIVLGGLISEDVRDSEQRVPILGSIPLLGHFFKFQKTDYSKGNLMVFLRAKIIRDDETLYGATAEKYRMIQEVQNDFRLEGLHLLNDEYIPELKDFPELDAKTLPASAYDGENDEKGEE